MAVRPWLVREFLKEPGSEKQRRAAGCCNAVLGPDGARRPPAALGLTARTGQDAVDPRPTGRRLTPKVLTQCTGDFRDLVYPCEEPVEVFARRG